MTGYYVLAGISVAWALLLTAFGLTRQEFPASRSLARALMGFAVALAVVTVGVLVASTHVEHPLEDAAAEGKLEQSAEENQEAKQAGQEREAKAGSEGGGANSVQEGAAAGAKTVPVKETEFKIDIAGGTSLAAGSYDLQVANDGKIEHDLAVEDGGPEHKTPLIKPGGKSDLKVKLEPGKYRFYCTVPGHAQSGMQQEVTVK
jgi:uncharacterized cupredoxin-like copper-binding protein